MVRLNCGEVAPVTQVYTQAHRQYRIDMKLFYLEATFYRGDEMLGTLGCEIFLGGSNMVQLLLYSYVHLHHLQNVN